MKKNHTPNHKNLLPMLPTQRHTSKTAVLAFFLLFFFVGFVGKGQTVDLLNMEKVNLKEQSNALVISLKKQRNKLKANKTIEHINKIQPLLRQDAPADSLPYILLVCNKILINEKDVFLAGEVTKTFLGSLNKKCEDYIVKNYQSKAEIEKESTKKNIAPKDPTATKKDSIKIQKDLLTQLNSYLNQNLQNLALALSVGLFLGLLLGIWGRGRPKLNFLATINKTYPNINVKDIKSWREYFTENMAKSEKSTGKTTNEVSLKELTSKLAAIPDFANARSIDDIVNIIKGLYEQLQKLQQTNKQTEINTTKTVENPPITPVYVAPLYEEPTTFLPVSSVYYARLVANVATEAFKPVPTPQTIYKVELIDENNALFSIEKMAQAYAIPIYISLTTSCFFNNIAPNSNTTSIETIQKGKLVYNGEMWVVKEKAVIVFK